MLSNVPSAFLQSSQGVLQIAMSHRSGSHDQGAVGNRFGHRLIHFGGRQRGRGAHCGTSIPERYVVRIHYPEGRKSKVAHGPRRRTNVERIAHVDEDNAQTGEFGGNGQAVAILRQGYGNHQPLFLCYRKAARG